MSSGTQTGAGGDLVSLAPFPNEGTQQFSDIELASLQTKDDEEADQANNTNDSGMTLEYLNYLRELSAVWKDCPPLHIAYKDLAYSIRNEATINDAKVAARREKEEEMLQHREAQLEAEERGEVVKAGAITAAPSSSDESIPNLAKASLDLVLSPFTLAYSAYRHATHAAVDPATVLTALHPCSGAIKPGSMTLVIAPPGAGKSTFLRALAGRLSSDGGLSGSLTYNGLTAQQLHQRGIHLTRLATYVGPGDISFPLLSVEETLEFARKTGGADMELLRKDPNKPQEPLESIAANRTKLLLDLLGLSECATTRIGNDLIRGVSGGQKKRVGIAEAMVSGACRLYALDEVSSGLDSAVTLHIMNALKGACQLTGSSVVTALQQTTPPTYALFDDVILMREGRVLYHGARTQVKGWLREVMHVPFIPTELEEAGFLVDLLSDPKQAMDKANIAYKLQLQNESKGRSSPMASLTPAPASTPSPTGKESASAVQPLDSASPVAGSSPVGGDAPAGAAASTPAVSSPAPVPVPVSPKGKIVRIHLSPNDEAEETSNNGKSSVTATGLGATGIPFKLTPDELASLQDIYSLSERASSSHAAETLRGEVTLMQSQGEELSSRYMDVSKWSPFTHRQYGRQFPHSTLYHTALCSARQVKLISRQLTMIVPRLINAILMGFVYGTLFFQLSEDDFSSRLGLIQNAVMFISFANFQELPVAAEGKQVVLRQINAGFYPSISYTLATNLLTLPLAALEVIVFGLIVYWVPGFDPSAGRFFFFMFLLLTISSAMSQMFRTIVYLSRNEDVAQQLNLPFIMLFVVFGGFLIPRQSVPGWLIWAYYISPFSWATVALGYNEFGASRYDDPATGTTERSGDAYLDAFGLRKELIWQWMGIVYLWGFYWVLTTVSTLLLAYTNPTQPLGTKRLTSSSNKKRNNALTNGTSHAASNGVNGNDTNVRIEITKADSRVSNGHANGHVNGNGHLNGSSSLSPPKKQLASTRSSAKASFHLNALPFTPATLAWKDLKYTVYLGREKTPRVLLNHISGYAKPGTLTALMGVSGAGKTTLMDVIAGRKTMGLIEHESNIFVNGRPKDAETFARMTGYVEQNDIHVGAATVREALEFSARLRLPASVSAQTRANFIDEVMALVDLTPIQHRLVGDTEEPSLSNAQLKLLTIAVELVANPPILFLDEPTTGLDAKSAHRVMSAIRRIAATNRTVICTIHQPSHDVFSMFDRLLLLRRGGETVYFDNIGDELGDSSKLVNYLTRVSNNAIPFSPLKAPADWMLDVVGLDAVSRAGGEEDSQTDAGADGKKGNKHKHSPSSSPKAQFHFAEAWRESEEAGRADKEVEELCTPEGVERATNGLIKPSESSHSKLANVEYASDWVRFTSVVYRAFQSHWRSPGMNVTRFLLMVIMGVFLGVAYFQLDVYDFGGISSLLAAVFLGVSMPSSTAGNASVTQFFRQRPVYYREKSVGMYGYLIYTASMTIVEVPYLFVALLFFLIPFYFMVGLVLSGRLFFMFLLACYLMLLFFSFMHQVFVAALPNLIVAHALNGLLMSTLFAFGGLFIKAAAIPIGWKWFYYIDPIPKAFIATIFTQVDCNGGVDSGASIDGCRVLTDVPNQPNVVTADYVEGMLEGDSSDYWPMIGWLILTCFVVRAFSVYLFKRVSHIER